MKLFGKAENKPIGKPEELVWRLELANSYVNQFGIHVDIYVMWYDKRSGESISLSIPHGRQDIAQYIQERLNKV